VGVKALGMSIKVEGMNNQALPSIGERLRLLTERTASYLNLDLHFEEDDFILIDACGSHP
jgi:hypothetical protein